LQRFGAIEIARAQYRRPLIDALATPAYFPDELLDGAAVASALQSSTLIS
jgi:hypothetical protein